MMGNPLLGLFSKWRRNVLYKKMTIVRAWDVFYGNFFFIKLRSDLLFTTLMAQKKIPMNRIMGNPFLGLFFKLRHHVQKNGYSPGVGRFLWKNCFIKLTLCSGLLHTMKMAQKKILMNRMTVNGFLGLFSKWRHRAQKNCYSPVVKRFLRKIYFIKICSNLLHTM